MFILLAKYNKVTNLEVVNILKNLDSPKLTENVGSYYGSILGILNHQLLADINWLRALINNIPELQSLSSLLEHSPSHSPAENELHWASLYEYQSVRVEVDDLIERVVKLISNVQYTSILKMENRRGKLEFVTWRILLHLFNHHAHHRGGVAVLLDQASVENDYSNLLWKI